MKKKLKLKGFIIDCILDINFVCLAIMFISKLTIIKMPIIIMSMVDLSAFIIQVLIYTYNKRVG